MKLWTLSLKCKYLFNKSNRRKIIVYFLFFSVFFRFYALLYWKVIFMKGMKFRDRLRYVKSRVFLRGILPDFQNT